MRPSKRRTLWVLMLALAGCGDASSPPDQVTGSVTGTVRDAGTGSPVAAVTVTIGSRTAQSASDGSYSIGELPVGRQRITATRTGYNPFTDSVTTSDNGPVVFDIALSTGPTGLTVVPGSSNGSLVISWNPVAGATSYTLYWGVTADPFHDGSRIDNATSPYTQEGLSAGTQRYFAVTVTTSLGESGPSAVVSAVPVNSITLTLVTISQTGTPDPTIGPVPNGFVQTSTRVAVYVTSVYSLESVVARIGAVTAPMTFVPSPSGGEPKNWWEATLDLTALPSPSVQPFSVTARNVLGDTASLSYSVRYDDPPVVTVELPTAGTVATPFIHVRATCTDDAATGCASLQVQVQHTDTGQLEPPFAVGQAAVDQVVSLAAYDGQQVALVFIGTDASGQRVYSNLPVSVETNSHLVPVASAGHGGIVDATADRLLVIDGSYTDDTVRIVDRASGSSVVVLAVHGYDEIKYPRLTSLGAILVVYVNYLPRYLYEWRNGVLTQISDGQASPLVVSGNFALYYIQVFGPLVRRDLSSGTNITVSTDRSEINGNSVAENGDAVFWKPDYNVSLYHAGATVKLTTDGSEAVRNIRPVTDGTHVVFTRLEAGQYQTVLYDPAGNMVLATGSETGPVVDYSVNNGWIAFTRPDAGGVRQVWIRSPAGSESQLSIFGDRASIEALGPTGEVVFISNNRRYRAVAGSSPVDIGKWQGMPIYIGSQLYIALGATLFRVD